MFCAYMCKSRKRHIHLFFHTELYQIKLLFYIRMITNISNVTIMTLEIVVIATLPGLRTG